MEPAKLSAFCNKVSTIPGPILQIAKHQFVIAARGVFCVTRVLCFCKAMKKRRLLVSLALKANNGKDDNVEASAMPSLGDTGGISDITPCPDAFPINPDLDLSLI
ncbi:hypothetical protein ILUMI_04029 [Ignelater luminosus]|uniref:Uncharacterized protein n=1 Tax=Ignelater luminosus TaxID=2038154 RepID=A0A8K0DAF2_IGNLU|nr:hypothetical protein ILUMI_04029 [Ignelater luminosus]